MASRSLFRAVCSAWIFVWLLACALPASSRVIQGLVQVNSFVNASSDAISEHQHNEHVQLLKRGNCFSSPDEPDEARCDPEYPTLEEARERALLPERMQQPPKKTFVFYQNFGGREVIPSILAWCACEERRARWGECILLRDAADIGQAPNGKPRSWVDFASAALRKSPKRSRVPVELASQVFAERASGEILFFYPDSIEEVGSVDANGEPYNEFQRRAVIWFGWEYPALQRNEAVSRIFRVDPREGQAQTVRLLWDRELNAIDTDEPRGLLESDPPI